VVARIGREEADLDGVGLAVLVERDEGSVVELGRAYAPAAIGLADADAELRAFGQALDDDQVVVADAELPEMRAQIERYDRRRIPIGGIVDHHPESCDVLRHAAAIRQRKPFPLVRGDNRPCVNMDLRR
jgi:hypothetical protein